MHKLAFLVISSLLFATACGSSPAENSSASSADSPGGGGLGNGNPLSRYPDGPEFTEIEGLWMLPPHTASCSKSDDSEIVFPFVTTVKTQAGVLALSPGMILAGATKDKVIPGWNFSSANFYTYSTSISPLDNESNGNIPCSSSTDCAEGYACASLTPSPGAGMPARQCVRPTEFLFASGKESVKFLNDDLHLKKDKKATTESKKQFVTFVIDRSWTLGDTFNGPAKSSPNYESVGDINERLLKNFFLSSYKSLLAATKGSSAFFSFRFSDDGPESDLIRCSNTVLRGGQWKVRDGQECEPITANTMEKLIGSASDSNQKGLKEFVDRLTSTVDHQNKVYSEMNRAADKMAKEEDGEKIMIVITGGPNNTYGNPIDGFAVLKDKLVKSKIRTFILQYDGLHSPLSSKAQESYDEYGRGRQCNSADDCYSNEVCRSLAGYSSSEKYCRPHIDSGKSFHFGPTAEFADIACATGGSFLYYTRSKASIGFFKSLPYILNNGIYTIKASRPSALKGVTGFYRLSGLFLLNFANNIATSVSAAYPDGSANPERQMLYLPEK